MCEIQEVETTQHKDGTLYYQSRSPKTPIVKTTYKYDLLVRIAKTPILDKPGPDEDE